MNLDNPMKSGSHLCPNILHINLLRFMFAPVNSCSCNPL
jgi:hypothetical protein